MLASGPLHSRPLLQNHGSSLEPPPLLARTLALSRRCGSSPEAASPRFKVMPPLTVAAAAAAGAGAGPRGYDRIPMKTSGAYQLVDRETGEKVIVWGGSNDGADSPMPSQEVLSWSPPGADDQPKGASASLPVAEVGNEPVASSGLGGFHRLKAQKVNALSRKSSKNHTGDARAGSARNVRDIPTGDSKDRDSYSIRRGRYADLKVSSTLRKEVDATKSKDMYARQDEDASYLDTSVPVASSIRGWGGVSSYPTTSTRQLKQNWKKTTDGGFFSRKSFKDVGCTDDMAEALRGLMFLRPSHIQAMAYGPILEGKSCIISDQSGSGKTMAYLAPTIQCLREEELEGLGKSSSGSPRVIILVPTAELASQVLSNCRSMAKSGVPFRSMIATGGFRQRTQLENLNEELDVLVATPGRFMYLAQGGFLQLTNLRRVILDEVDILFRDEGFEQVLDNLINSAPMSAQYLFVTATLPVDIYSKVVEIFPDLDVIMGPGMHRTSSGLEEVLVDCSGTDGEEKNPETAFLNKKSALLQLLEESPVRKTIVFCNKIETCRKVENILNRFDRKGSRIKVLPFHAAVAQEARLSNMRAFLDSHSEDSMYLICTDRASRGIDFAAVDRVVLFDFPRDPSEYVRRVGRTARGAGGKGKAYVFVVGKQVSLARRIMERNKKGRPLHDLPCASSTL